MLNVHPLYSSSSGNLWHLESSNTNILIDAGVTYKAINDGLHSIQKDISDISAVIITHEHIDHIRGLCVLCKKHHIPIYACGETADYIDSMLKEKMITATIIRTSYGISFNIEDLTITPFETSHDAIMPCGYTITNGEKKISFSTDLGYVSKQVYENISDSDMIILEANYDESMLDFGPYPYPVKRRIKSNMGHLSNIECGNTIAKILQQHQPEFILAHLSEKNNTAEIAKNTIDSILMQHEFPMDSIHISFASKTLSSEVYGI